MKQIVFLFFAVIFLVTFKAQAQENNNYCFMCHGMATLSVKDSTFGIIKRFDVNEQAFGNSHHGDLDCVECHSEDFADFPHKAETLEEKLQCSDCHDEDLEIHDKNFSKITEEFEESIHYKTMGEEFNCSVCHDPHTMDLRKSSIWEIRKSYPLENQMCVECHDTHFQWREGDSQRVNLKAVHSEVEKDINNWQTKKCIDCHTEKSESGLKHNIIELTKKNFTN